MKTSIKRNSLARGITRLWARRDEIFSPGFFSFTRVNCENEWWRDVKMWNMKIRVKKVYEMWSYEELYRDVWNLILIAYNA